MIAPNQNQAGERTHFNPKYSSAFVVLRDGSEIPVLEVFNRNPSVFQIVGIRCADREPGKYCFAKGYSDPVSGKLCRVTMGASGTPIAFRDPATIAQEPDLELESAKQDAAIIARADISVRPRVRKELQIVRRLIADLQAAGYSLAVDDGGERITGNADKLIEAAFGVDESHILTRKDGENSFVFLVMGNGEDVICDYGTSLETVIEPVSAWIEEMQERGE